MALRTSLAPQPHLYMGDMQGRPLDAGKVYFGQPNKDPEFYPINVFYDEALTIAAPQPIRTMGGFMNANGQMVEIYAAETEYSVKVLDGYGRQVFYQASMSSTSTSTSVSTKLPYPTAITRSLEDKNSDTVSVKDFGAKGDGVTDDAAAIQAAINSDADTVNFPDGIYLVSNEITIPKTKQLKGAGVGHWNGRQPTQLPEKHTHSGTAIVLMAGATKTRTIKSISSMKASGGRIANPSAMAGLNDAYYQLESFLLPSNGAREYRKINCGIYISPEARGTTISDMRIIPDGRITTNYLDIYNLVGAGADQPWASDWDVGIYNDAAAQVQLNNVQSVGHFRITGYLTTAIESQFGSGAHNPYGAIANNCVFAGFKPLVIRGADNFIVKAVTSSTVEIPWADDHPFDPILSGFFASNKRSFTGFGHTYTAVEKVNVGGEDRLRFNGVSPDPTINIVVSNYIASRGVAGGTSQLTFNNCRLNGIYHPSGYMSHDQRLGSKAFDYAGGAIEISGWRLTEINFNNCYAQHNDPVIIHLHECSNINFNDIGLESDTSKDGTRGARIISSPAWTTPRNPNDAGQSWRITLSGYNTYLQPDIDFRPLIDVTPASRFTNPGDNGFMQAKDCFLPNFALRAKADVGNMLTSVKGGKGGIYDSKELPKIYYDELLGRVVLATSIVPVGPWMQLGEDGKYFGPSHFRQTLQFSSLNEIGVNVKNTFATLTQPLQAMQALRSKTANYSFLTCYTGSTNYSGDRVFEVKADGNVYADGTYNTPAADYAEYFEWSDGNSNGADRVGYSVVLTDGKIRTATSKDSTDDIIGIISAKPSVVGDSDCDSWAGKYLTDDFGRELLESYELEDGTTHDDDGNLLERPMLNPEYDADVEHTPRSKRKEWDAVGLMGKLWLRKGEPVNPKWLKLQEGDKSDLWLVR